MQIALLSGASPLTCKEAPIVRLQKGDWKFEMDTVDSILSIHLIHPSHESFSVERDVLLRLDKTETVQLRFEKRGTEKYITINAKKVN